MEALTDVYGCRYPRGGLTTRSAPNDVTLLLLPVGRVRPRIDIVSACLAAQSVVEYWRDFVIL
jgi:hypothetical protein